MNIAHRDIKHHNILVTSELLVKICDFGISKCYQEEVPKETTCVGTIAFHSPEVYKNDNFDPRKCDI